MIPGFNQFGNKNVSIGFEAMNTSYGSFNVAIGADALNTVDGNSNTAVGNNSGLNTTSGVNNTFVGDGSGALNETGINNVMVGQLAGYNTDASSNTYVGRWSGLQNFTGTCNTALGYGAGSANGQANLTNTTAIGCDARATASNRIRIGNTAITRIGGEVGWSTLSDGRYKTNVSEGVVGLDFIMKLRPVTYNLNEERTQDLSDDIPNKSDIQKIEFTGFIAQEVEQAAISSNYNFSGVHKPVNEDDTYALTYSEFTVPLVKAVQELNSENVKLREENKDLQKQLDDIIIRLEKLEK